jgi:hypothetical protein
MTDGTEQLFLVVFDSDEQALVHDVVVFDDAPDALRAYTLTEDLHRGHPKVEVVLLLADSIATLEVTHRIYFPGAGDDDRLTPLARTSRSRAATTAVTP